MGQPQLSKDRKYRVAMVGGAGTFGQRYLQAYAIHPDCEIVALVDTAKERRDVFAQHYGVKVVYDTVEELLKHDIPDIVTISIPVAYQHDAVIACAQSGVKVVSCEKPIAAELAKADEMVRVCRERGVSFGCGTGHWDAPYLLETAAWIRDGHIGKLTGAAIPFGLPNEVSGGGCIQIVMMRLMTDMEVAWVEGWTVPPEAAQTEVDCGAYGLFGMSGGILCGVPDPDPEAKGWYPVAVTGEDGQVWISEPKPVLIVGTGARARPIYPEFLNAPGAEHSFCQSAKPRIERFFRAFDTGDEVQCSGHDYRQALEVAIALKLSARLGHKRVHLPLEDRSLKLYPHGWRWRGGDAVGWHTFPYQGKPQIIERVD